MSGAKAAEKKGEITILVENKYAIKTVNIVTLMLGCSKKPKSIF
jgi:hypothetical protein